GATWIGSNAPLTDISKDALVKFETAVMPIPQFNPDEPYMISQGPSLCIFNKEDPGEVLASWLFTQYLLTNDVQISYSQTEGYAPVTTKARETAEYQDYLSRSGEDNDKYYDVKIAATKLLLANTDKTFITPVFNGSASLRSAAGQLIEDVTMTMRRKKPVDDAFFAEEKEKIISLFHLDSITASGTAKKELGELPAASKALIIILILVWIGIIAYFVSDRIKEAKKRKH
ncbi:MAG: extracellular solute-binding protein, partial [Lachnospiraceae bacterium]|nr:extracellular solute-binding protein [Lachnospiraceae bacterium]